MSTIFEFISGNIEWMFSGAGLIVFSFVYNSFKKRENIDFHKEDEEKSKKQRWNENFYGYYRSPEIPEEINRMVFTNIILPSGERRVTVKYIDNKKVDTGVVKMLSVKSEVYLEIACSDGHYDHRDYITVTNKGMEEVYIGTYCSIGFVDRIPCCGVQVITNEKYDKKSKYISDLIEKYEDKVIKTYRTQQDQQEVEH